MNDMLTMLMQKAMGGAVMVDEDTDYMNDLLLKNGKIQVVDSSVYENIPRNHLRLFCLRNGLYQLPTTELLEWVKEKIGGRRAIEIGSGNGVFAESLGITATDSYMQKDPEVAALYRSMNQPTVKYGKNVKKFDAKKAIKKFKPKVVVACWVTQIYKPDSDQGNMWGVDEEWLLKRVDTYIHIGNKKPHKKRILNQPHEEYQFPWLVSRGQIHEDNIIYVWNKKKKNSVIHL